MKGMILGLGSWLILAPTASALDLCAHHAERNLDLDARGIETLVVAARAGDLDIRGEPGLEQVIVRGKACASDAERLAGIRLVERREGSKQTVAVEVPELGGGWFGNNYQRLDLEVRVPARLALDVTDSSGDARVRGVASARVDDSSGDLEIEDIAGDLTVTDSSGDIEVRNVGGNLRIPSDSSGDIDVVGVSGDAVVESDSSGSILLRDVRGDARVEDDSSGDIRFVDIGGSAFVGDDSSGEIVAERVGRDFTVESDGSGGIRHSDVRGKVTVPAR